MHRVLPVWVLLLLVLGVGPRRGEAAGPRSGPGDDSGPRGDSSPCRSDECPVCCAARQVGLRMVPLRDVVVYRCSPSPPPVRITFPRGRVRVEDLDAVHVHVGDEAPPTLGGFRVLLPNCQAVPLTWGAELLREAFPIPETLRRTLSQQTGRVVWQVLDEGALAEDTVVDLVRTPRQLARELERIDTALQAKAGSTRRLVKARVLLDAGFFTAAWRETEVVFAEHPDEPHAAAIHHAALRGVGLHDWEETAQFESRRRILRILGSRAQQRARCRVDELDAPDPAWDRPRGRIPDVTPRPCRCGECD